MPNRKKKKKRKQRLNIYTIKWLITPAIPYPFTPPSLIEFNQNHNINLRIRSD